MQETSSMLNLVVQYGYVTLFIVVVIENLEFFGSFPISVIAAAMGAVAAEGVFNIWISIALLTVASVLGDVLGYWVGRKFGRPVLLRWGGRMIKNGRLEKAEALVDKYGSWSVFVTRAIFASFQAIINIIAGVTRMSFFKFFIACLSGEFIWSITYFFLGYYFWSQVSGALQKISSFGVFGVILSILVAIVLYLLYRYRARIFKQKNNGNIN
ncbi:MAG: hypothetical protein COT25_04425 [Candidatus Kerfeldbacteria bacterium CG08_land_8_20_14_0_20_42_7]|uniref:VTT domain-containing protein n=1 Tax=Candidatus Kerfeldbacteria bacterium CG08_land_8_20_14_0_20_42_7 TaxID=2014245 RepID=A0A2H0YRS6_9BACT|nr:MAG: hypothetical protein COT25_04425 [Candidatus Kerfeldbacteria bacterium CG08_land_8_20_14_0_20_42_7]